MAYDWRGNNFASDSSKEFFAEMDRRLFEASPLYRGKRPFDRLIPFESLVGKRILEIGCGLGAHTELFASSPCEVSAIDITERAVELSQRRLAFRGLNADIRQMDAEHMTFADGSFDFVWSWGVIHHSASTDQIVREVARVLKPGGEFRFMVYSRRSLDAYLKILRGFVTGKPLRKMTVPDILSYYTDGYIARFYTRRELRLLLVANGFGVDSISTFGQTSELVPLPGTGLTGSLKRYIVSKVPDKVAEYLLTSLGSFLFAVAFKAEN